MYIYMTFHNVSLSRCRYEITFMFKFRYAKIRLSVGQFCTVKFVNSSPLSMSYLVKSTKICPTCLPNKAIIRPRRRKVANQNIPRNPTPCYRKTMHFKFPSSLCRGDIVFASFLCACAFACYIRSIL